MYSKNIHNPDNGLILLCFLLYALTITIIIIDRSEQLKGDNPHCVRWKIHQFQRIQQCLQLRNVHLNNTQITVYSGQNKPLIWIG